MATSEAYQAGVEARERDEARRGKVDPSVCKHNRLAYAFEHYFGFYLDLIQRTHCAACRATVKSTGFEYPMNSKEVN